MTRPSIALVVLLLFVGAGCAAPIGGQPTDATTVRVTDATVAAGETAIVTIVATNVGGMSFDPPGDPTNRPVEFTFEDAKLSPPPDVVWTSDPPTWTWDRARGRVTAEIPVRVPGDTPPGDYPFRVTVQPVASVDDGSGVDAGGTVTVVAG